VFTLTDVTRSECNVASCQLALTSLKEDLLRRMVSSGMLLCVALVKTDVSVESSAYFLRVTRIGELGTTLAVTGNRSILRRLLGTTSVVPSVASYFASQLRAKSATIVLIAYLSARSCAAAVCRTTDRRCTAYSHCTSRSVLLSLVT
jgi:hypothetical protein